jgi:Asp-tRNA(Asn)/Glu-tRNA(Gln) amidotransferase A subunit family amidase
MRERALQSCLDRIREMDPSIHAWVQVSPQRPTGRGKLSEIPFGVKDIIETRGLATEYGSPIYKGRIGTADAAIVREMRKRGAILLGKTQCTAFAYFTPPPTRNPRDLEHTPGGSSSGSAAAVAAGMVPVALGTQTKGSVLRPASFCGVTGFKASYGLLPMEGVLPLANSLDTLGFFTHTPADMLALWESMEHPVGQSEDFALGAPEPVPEVEPAMVAAFQNVLSLLRSAGASILSIDIVGMLAKLSDATDTVTFYEGARFHQQRFNEYGSRLGAELVDLVQKGLQISVERYDEARRYIAECKAVHSDAGLERVAARAATHCRARARCQSNSHCRASAKNARNGAETVCG